MKTMRWPGSLKCWMVRSLAEHGTMRDGVTYRWLKLPILAGCEKCHHKVFPGAWRVQVHDGLGPHRRGGKGANSSYWCTECAWRHGTIIPPKDVEPKIVEESEQGPSPRQEALWE